MSSHPSTLECALLLVGVTAGISAPFQAETSPHLGSVRGTVTNAVTGERLSKAYVLLSATSATRANYPVVTDSQGRFRIESVEPGNYHLQAERQGFLEGHYGGGFTG